MSELNPFAPPLEQVHVPLGRATASGELADALGQLAAHTQNANAMERDREAAGPRVRIATMVFGGLFVLALIASVLGSLNDEKFLLVVGLVFAGLFALFAIILLVLDLSLVVRGSPSTPEVALKSYLRAITTGRNGYAWAALAPTARRQIVAVPSLGPIPVGFGELSMQDMVGAKAYFASFARPGNGQIRQMAIKRITLAHDGGDVAKLDVELTFHSYPQWVSIVVAIGFVLFRPLVLVGLIVLLAMRKRCSVAVQKTLLRAPTGAWYIHDANLLESRRDLP
jgi:hypothetical protein